MKKGKKGTHLYYDAKDIIDQLHDETRMILTGLYGQGIKKEIRKLILYIISVARLLYAKSWKSNEMPKAVDWIKKINLQK